MVWVIFPHSAETSLRHRGAPHRMPAMLVPEPPRLRPREVCLLCLLAVWVVALLRVEHAPPLTPPAVPYAASR